MPFKAPQVSGCPKNWAEMDGDERKRYCQHCSLHVHDISAMPRQEAEKILAEADGRLCVTYLADSQGNLLTLDEVKAAGYDVEKIPMRSMEPGQDHHEDHSHKAKPAPLARSRWSVSWLLTGLTASFASVLALTGCTTMATPPSGHDTAGFATPPPAVDGKEVQVTKDQPPREMGRTKVEYRTVGIIAPTPPPK